MFKHYKWVKIETAHRRFLPTRSFSKSENLDFGAPFARKRCAGRCSTRVRKRLSTRFYCLGQSLGQREQRRALFHSTPEGPIDRGTITQAILVKSPFLPYGHENLRGFFSRFYLGSRYQIGTKVVCL